MNKKVVRGIVYLSGIVLIALVITVVAHREVDVGGGTAERSFSSESSYPESAEYPGYFEETVGHYPQYDTIVRVDVSLRGRWENGILIVILQDEAGKEYGRWEFISGGEIVIDAECDAPEKGVFARFIAMKGSSGHVKTSFEDYIYAYERWLK